MATDTKSALEAMNKLQATVENTQDSSPIFNQPWSESLVKTLSGSVLLFCIIAMVLATALLWKHSPPPSMILRIFGVIAILGLSTMLLIVGYSNEQLTPIVGLFGAIAGYLLGKDSKPAD